MVWDVVGCVGVICPNPLTALYQFKPYGTMESVGTVLSWISNGTICLMYQALRLDRFTQKLLTITSGLSMLVVRRITASKKK